MYILAILVPPLALFLCYRFVQALFCLILLILSAGLLYPMAIFWAILVVKDTSDNFRTSKIIDSIKGLK